MSSFIITKTDGTTFDLYDKNIPSTILSGNQDCRLLSEDTLTIQTKSAKPLPLSIGDKCTIYGKKYKINTQPSIKKQEPRKFITDIIFEGVQYELLDAQFLLPDNTIGDSLTGNLKNFLDTLIWNANRIGIWETGTFPTDTEYKTLTFTGENCLSVLQRICEEWEQEFEIEQSGGTNFLHIRTAGVDFPYTFSYGSSGGLYELTRKNIDSENIVTRLYAYGGSNNLGNEYLSSRGCGKLCLPGKNKNNSFIQEANAINNYGAKENTKVFDSIFPNRYGTVTALGEDYLSFIDDTMTFDLNEKETDGVTTKYLIAGVSAKVHFNTGKLAGYEFELESYDNQTKKLKLIPFEDENGMSFPSPDSEAFRLATGDEYFFIDIRLPQAYIDEAEAKLQAEAEAYYAQNSQPRVQYELKIHDNFLKRYASQVTIANLFAVGDYIPVEDNDVGVSKSIRITGFTRDILKPYKYDITLGEAVTKSTVTRLIKEQRSIEEIIRFNKLNDPSRARRNWRASQEVLSMVFDTEGDYYSDRIKPLSIETNMLNVGAKSMQFVLSNVVFEPNYQGNPNVVKAGGGQLIHYAIENEIRIWNIASETVSNLQSQTPYYIYVRCLKTRNGGNIIIDTEQRKIDHKYKDENEEYYTFMIGVLNSVETDSDGSNPGRLVSLTYGSSTISGRFIKTGRIESSGGSGSFFDLDNNQFQIGDKNKGLAWNINNDGQLILKGTLIQSPAGETTQPIGYYRGEYNPNYTYYEGDIVSYGGSTYRFIYPTPQTGKNPTNTAYWAVYAAKGEDGEPGAKGEDGSNGEPSDWKTFAYKKSASKPNTPTDTSPIPDNWQDYPDSEAEEGDKWWMTVAIVHWTGNEWLAGAYINNTFTPGQWSNPIPVTGEQGTDGQYVDFKFYATSNMNAPGWNNTLASMLNPTGWLDQLPQLPPYGAIWMIEAYKQAGGTQLITTWSDPARISGEKGQDGTDGQDGQDGLDGTDGKDGTDIEFIYARTTDPEEEPQTPETEQQDDYVPEGWTDTPQGVTSTYICELVSVRSKQNGIWGEFSHPAVWSKWGEKGKDGDGYEYIYRRTETENMPVPPASKPKPDDEWTDEPQGVTAALPYEWVSTRKQENSVWSAFSRPVIWARYAKDGTNGSYTSFVFKLSETPPDAPAGTNPIPSGWSDSPASSYNVSNISHDSVWTLQADGTRKSPAIGNNGFTKNRISFATSQPNQEITIYLKVSSETNYDFALVGQADNPNLSRTANYTDRISGETEKEISVNIPGAGEHYIEIGYGKDGSANGRQDCAWYSVNSGPIWWMSKATVSYQNGQWQAGVWSDPVKVTAEDGNNGVDGKFWDYKYITDSSAPETPQGLNPSGWFDQPPAINAEYGDYLWMSYCEKDAGQTQILWGWSTPVRISGEDGKNGTNGTNGKDGTAGAYYERRFATSGSPTQWPDYPGIPFGSSPSGWTLEVPVVSPLQYLWVIEAKIQPSEKAGAIPSWSTPARITGEKGEKGDKGDAGNTGPAMVFRGEYSSAETYYGTLYRVDAVRVTQSNGSFLYYVTRSDAGTISGTDPADGSKWNPFESQLQSVATNLLLAEMANIAGWIFKNQRLESQDGRMFLDGNGNGNIIAENEKGYKLKIGTNIDGLNNSGLILENDTGETIGSLLFISYSPEILISSLYFLHKNLNIDMKLTAADGLSFGRRNKSGGLIANSNIGYSGIYFNGNSNYNTFQLQTESTNMILMMNGLPTSSSGLSKGQVWRDVNTLKIV